MSDWANARKLPSKFMYCPGKGRKCGRRNYGHMYVYTYLGLIWGIGRQWSSAVVGVATVVSVAKVATKLKLWTGKNF